MRFTLKNPRSLQYIDYQNVRKTEFLGCQSQEETSTVELTGTVMENLPSTSVTTPKGVFVSIKVTLAPGSGSPPVSVMTPDRTASDCAKEATAPNSNVKTRSETFKLRFFILTDFYGLQ